MKPLSEAEYWQMKRRGLSVMSNPEPEEDDREDAKEEQREKRLLDALDKIRQNMGTDALVAALGEIAKKMSVKPPEIPAPVVNVTVPPRTGGWVATVVERGGDGAIKKVRFEAAD